MILVISRFIPAIPLSVLTSNTMQIPGLIRIPLEVICSFLGIYTTYSMVKYLGTEQACGGDHFFIHY